MVNKKLFMSLFVFIAIIGLAGAGTFAYFSSSVTSYANTINTGSISLGQTVTLDANTGKIVPDIGTQHDIKDFTLTPTNDVPADLISTITVTNYNPIPAEMVITANINGVDHILVSGNNAYTITEVPTGVAIPVKVFYTFKDNGSSGQIGQGQIISVSGEFMLRQHV